jgi:cell division septation protein DedD
VTPIKGHAPKKGAENVSMLKSAAPVMAKEIPVSQPAPMSVQTADGQLASAQGPCFLHVGVFANESNTLQAKEQLEKLSIMNVLMREVALNDGKTTATQVRVGPFASRQEADSERARISDAFSGHLGGTACLEANAK